MITLELTDEAAECLKMILFEYQEYSPDDLNTKFVDQLLFALNNPNGDKRLYA